MNRTFNILAAASMAACALWLAAPAAAAPITSSMGLQNALAPSAETVQYRRGWRGGDRGGYRGGRYGAGLVTGAIIGGAILGATQPYGYYGYGSYDPYGYGYAPGYYQPYYGSPAYPRYYGPYQQCTPENAGRADAGC